MPRRPAAKTAEAQAIQRWLFAAWLSLIPKDRVKSVCAWAKEYVRLPVSIRGEEFDPDITPWTREPIECAGDGTVLMNLCKPVQTGGSVVGEVAILFWLVHRLGSVGYFWPNKLAADNRWLKRVEETFTRCAPLMAKVPEDRFKWQKGLVLLPTGNFEMKGVNSDRSVASDTIPFIVNEELHVVENGWESGRLQQVYARQTACWQKACFNISNAGFAETDWHKAWKAGTQEHWEVLCPGCKQYHVMRCRWEDSRPDLGGLRYDATGSRLGVYDYDYNRLVANGIYYQMPCDFKVRDDVMERRQLSQSGRYGESRNKSALPTERSFVYEAVSCDTVQWLDIIKRKHAALKAMALGNFKPWFDYLREVECIFVDIGRDRPAPERTVIISSDKPKSREGMPERVNRWASADWQLGSLENGIPPHFWLLIQDFDALANSLIVYEGRVDSEGELAAVLKEHDVSPVSVVVDSSWDTQRIYALCLKYGYNALKADDKLYWSWDDGTSRFYSEPRPLYAVANAPPSQEDPALEPCFWLVSKYVGMERLVYLRQSKQVKYGVPKDVSKDFLDHFDSWKVEVIRKKDGQNQMKWRQLRDADHLFQCAAYILSMVDLSDGFDGLGGMPAPADTAYENPQAGQTA